VAVAVGAARDEHGLDRDHQARLQLEAAARLALVGDVRLLVHRAADAVAAVVGQHPEPGGARDRADGVRDVAQPRPRRHGGDPGGERALGGVDEREVARVGPVAHHHAERRVGAPPVEVHGEVDRQQVARLQRLLVRHAVHHRVVDADARDRRYGPGAHRGW
jgi:hypothetical protein